MPKPLVRGDQTFQRTAAVLLRGHAAARQHGFERFQQLLGNHKVLCVAGMMERDKNLVGKAAALAWACGARTIAPLVPNPVFFSKLAHARPAGRPRGNCNPLDTLTLALLGI